MCVKTLSVTVIKHYSQTLKHLKKQSNQLFVRLYCISNPGPPIIFFGSLERFSLRHKDFKHAVNETGAGSSIARIITVSEKPPTLFN